MLTCSTYSRITIAAPCVEALHVSRLGTWDLCGEGPKYATMEYVLEEFSIGSCSYDLSRHTLSWVLGNLGKQQLAS